jgi:hypothetical protein
MRVVLPEPVNAVGDVLFFFLPPTRFGESRWSPSQPHRQTLNPKDFQRPRQDRFQVPASSTVFSFFRTLAVEAGLAHARCSRKCSKIKLIRPSHFKPATPSANKVLRSTVDLALDTLISHANLTNNHSRSILYSLIYNAQWYLPHDLSNRSRVFQSPYELDLLGFGLSTHVSARTAVKGIAGGRV